MKTKLLAYRLIKKILNSCQKMRRSFRYFAFLLESKLEGGKLLAGKNVKINHKVKFQGKGVVQVEDNVTLGFRLGGSSSIPILLQPRESNSIIQIGSGSTIVNGTEIICREKVTIGKKCLIGSRCTIVDSDFHSINPSDRTGGLTLPVTLGDNVWLGLGVTILKGVTIGNDAVVGAGSIVTKDIPPGGIAGGNPARIIGSAYDKP